MIDNKILQLSNFHSNFDDYIQDCQVANFKDVVFQNRSYYNVCPTSADWAYEEIEKRTQLRNIDPVIDFLRCYRDIDAPKEQTYIHSDAGLCDWIGILYLLNRPRTSNGTALWQHKFTLRKSFPVEKDFHEMELETKERQSVYDYYNVDGMHEGRWKLHRWIPFRENRLAIFPAKMFHSKYPRVVVGERLIQVFFFNAKLGV